MSLADDKLQRLQTQAEEVKLVIRESINKAIERGDNLDQIALKAQTLESDALTFEQGSRRLRTKYCREHWKRIICIGSIISLIILIVALVIWSKIKNN